MPGPELRYGAHDHFPLTATFDDAGEVPGPCTLNPEPSTLNPKPYALNPSPWTQTLNPKP